MGLKGKFGVYGRSLGGIATTHLADKVDLIIADRTFCNFRTLADRKFYDPISKYLFKGSSCNWTASNDVNFISKGIGTCYKIIIVDKNDEIIDIHSSLV